MATDDEVAAARQRIQALRDEIEETEREGAQAVVASSNDVTIAQLSAEEAALRDRLQTTKDQFAEVQPAVDRVVENIASGGVTEPPQPPSVEGEPDSAPSPVDIIEAARQADTFVPAPVLEPTDASPPSTDTAASTSNVPAPTNLSMSSTSVNTSVNEAPADSTRPSEPTPGA